MATTPVRTEIERIRNSAIWRSIFRSGSGASNLHRAEAVQQNLVLHLFSVKIRSRALEFKPTWYLGALTLSTFFILVVTGILLMFYYHPSVPQAYADMKDLKFVVASGVFLRNLHRWSAHAMVFLVFAHMFKVFYRGAYRPPRQFNWVIGVFLLLVTLLLSYTGYLLPWDQLAFWAVTVGSNIAKAVPFMGQKIRFLLLGGNEVNANALLRFYVLHCVILPLCAVALVAIHFWRIRKDGGLYVPERLRTRQGRSRDVSASSVPPPAGRGPSGRRERSEFAQSVKVLELYVSKKKNHD